VARSEFDAVCLGGGGAGQANAAGLSGEPAHGRRSRARGYADDDWAPRCALQGGRRRPDIWFSCAPGPI